MASWVWPTSTTVSGCVSITSSRPGQRVSRRPDLTAASIAAGGFCGPRALQPEQEQRDRDGGVVELELAQQADVEGAEIVITEGEIEPLFRRRDGFAADPDLVADKQRGDLAMAIIFEQMHRLLSAILAVDDVAAGGAGVALVGDDQFQRMTEQFDMLVIDRGDACHGRADQAHRVVAAADAGLEHREIATALLKMQAGQREQRLEGSEFLSAAP